MSAEDDRTVFQASKQQPPAGAGPPPGEAPAGDDRTVFQAGGSTSPGASSAPEPSIPPAAGDDRTIFQSAAPPQPSAPPAPSAPSAMPRTVAGVQVGDRLNHMFEVKRFIARGGMGEVFEGIELASEEPVAIKIVLPALAADPNVTAMFRKEAQTLTRLSHPALVQYRVLGQDPQLNVFYIVTDFIDGTDLGDVMGKISPSPAQLIGLIRRLAEGLRAAHDLGAIHRDIAPDNVLLQGGRLERARIIDFGIAKDVDPGSKTIIGDGFAGKLGYVAPEQLGMFGRDVGPWTDVYSLGLVVLALALGRSPGMGGSFVDAIDKRRAGVDTGGAPPELRALLGRMMALDPADRFRDMGEVLAALAKVEAGEAIAPPAPPPGPAQSTKSPNPATVAEPAEPPPPVADRGRGMPKPALIGGGAAAALAVLAIVGWVALGGDEAAPPADRSAAAPAKMVAAGTVRGAVERTLPGLACTWLTLTGAGEIPQGATLAFAGVAGRPADAEANVFKAVQATGATVSSSDFSGVVPIEPSFCAVLDRLRPIRAAGESRLSVSQPKFEIAPFVDGDNVGQNGARVIFDLSLADLPGDFALYGVEGGEITAITKSRAEFMKALDMHIGIERLPGQDRYRVQSDGVRQPGWSGILLLTGRGGFSDSLFQNTNSADWPTRFDRSAKSNDWKSEVVWFRFVDDLPN